MNDDFLTRLAKAEDNDNEILKHEVKKREKGTYTCLYNMTTGKYSRVMCAKKKKDESKVVIKLFYHPASFKLFFSEFKALRALEKSRYVVDILDAYQMPIRKFVVVLELAPQSMRSFLRRSSLKKRNTFIWMLKDIYAAFVEIHSMNIAHRDIKPDNILLWQESQTIKLCDFEFAACLPKNINNLTTMCGTPVYMAPELFGKKPYNGFAVDIWAYGCIIFEFFTNVPPFQFQDMMTLKRNIIGRKMVASHLPLVPTVWKYALLRCFNKQKQRLENIPQLLKNTQKDLHLNSRKSHCKLQ